MIAVHQPEPSYESAQEALLDLDYAAGMDSFDRAYQSLSDVIWQEHYLREVGTADHPIGDLPDISRLIEKQKTL
jgi:hypothetical protein